jgi:ribose 5-phosphate isomerase A
MTIFERALELVPDGSKIGLGSGRASWAFVGRLGEKIRAGELRVRGVAASLETASVAQEHGVPLVELEDAEELALTVDGADEFDPNLELIKGYGRALVREKVVAASSHQFIILVGEEKRVPKLGSRGRLPVEVIPFALSFCRRKLSDLGLRPQVWDRDGKPCLTDNGNCILDCETDPIDDPRKLDEDIRRIPGVVGSGLFVGMADIVLVGGERYSLIEEMRRAGS